VTDKERIAQLETALDEAARGLLHVTHKKMFGCHALFAAGNVFALVWKHGRIGIKLMDGKDHERLLSMEGAGAWEAGVRKMTHWVLVPESLHQDRSQLSSWTGLAYRQALAAPAKAVGKKKASPPVKVFDKMQA
jgi:TfoX/Sxy family transcriptional regulator of competence genes